jgi:hypothetical protein
MYNWSDVAARTLRVYDAVRAAPWRPGLLPRLRRALRAGPWAGPLWCCVLVLLYWWWRLLEWLQPASGIEIAPDWPRWPADCFAAAPDHLEGAESGWAGVAAEEPLLGGKGFQEQRDDAQERANRAQRRAGRATAVGANERFADGAAVDGAPLSPRELRRRRR